jgi:hypothetical protein
MMGIKVFLIDFSQLILPLMYQTFKMVLLQIIIII